MAELKLGYMFNPIPGGGLFWSSEKGGGGGAFWPPNAYETSVACSNNLKLGPYNY